MLLSSALGALSLLALLFPASVLGAALQAGASSSDSSPTSATRALPILAERQSLALAGIEETRLHLGGDGLFGGQTYDEGGKFYSVMAEYDSATKGTRYRTILNDLFPQAESGHANFATATVGQGLIYGFAAVRAYAAYRDPIFLHYAITAWESANSLTLTQQMLDFGVIPPGKNFSAITTCQGSSMAGGTLQATRIDSGVIDSSTTSLFGLISAYLAEATSNATYLSAASNSISFLRAQLFSNVTNLATQAISAQNCDTDTKLVVFNSAFMLELVAVFLSVSPNLNPELRNLLHDLFNAVTQSSLFISSSGAIKGGDMALPHAVFTAYSRNLTMGVQKQAAESFLSRQFDAVTLQASSGGSNIYSTNWDGPPPAENTTFSAHVQDPALVALVGSLYLPETAAAPSISKSAAAVDSGKTKPNVGGMIAGAVVGGLFVVGFFVAGAVIFTRRRRRLQEEENKSEVSPPPVNPYVFSTPPTVSSRSDAGRPSWVSPKRGRNNNVSVQRETVVSDSSVSTEEVVRQLYFRMNQVPMDGEAPPGYGSR